MSEVEKVSVYYILMGHKIISVDVDLWAKWMSRYENRVVKKTLFEEGVFVDTVFFGTDADYSLGSKGRPRLFKTSISGGRYGDFGDFGGLSCLYAGAMKRHQRAVQYLRNLGYIELSSSVNEADKYVGQKIVVLKG